MQLIGKLFIVIFTWNAQTHCVRKKRTFLMLNLTLHKVRTQLSRSECNATNTLEGKKGTTPHIINTEIRCYITYRRERHFGLFSTFFVQLDGIRYRRCPQNFMERQRIFWKLVQGMPHLLRRVNEVLSLLSTFTAQFVTDPHILMQHICECRENQRRKGQTFVIGINEITFKRVSWNCTVFRN